MSATLRRLAATLTVLVVAGCNLAQLISGPTPSPTPQPRSVYGDLFARIGPNGEIDKQLALDAFAVAIAPLPGVTTPTGLPPYEGEGRSASFAARWLMNWYDELTPEQKAVVDEKTGPPPGVEVQRPRGIMPVAPLAAGVGLMPAAAGVVTAADDVSMYNQLLRDAEAKISQKLGRPLKTSWVAGTTTDATQWLGLTNYYPAWGCSFKFPTRLAGMSEGLRKATVAHEMFHCFQFDITGWRTTFNPWPAWIIEGSAEYVGEALEGPSEGGIVSWNKYLTESGDNLYQQEYDATGFYWQLAEAGINLWSRFDAMFAGDRTDNDAAFKAIGGNEDAFLHYWASGLLKRAEFGNWWNTRAAGWTTDDSALADLHLLGPSEQIHVEVPRLINEIHEVSTVEDIVELRMTGFGRLHYRDGDLTKLDQVWLCLKADACVCPEGQHWEGPDLMAAGGPLDLGMTGGLSGAEATFTAHDRKEFCKPDESPRPTSPDEPGPGGDEENCVSDCGMSNGDPHIYTLDNHVYDFQAAGEFVLLRNADRSFEIHVRQQPYGDSDHVSVNTAIAMKIGSHRAGIYATDDGNDATATLDGNQITTTTDVDGGGRMRREGSGWRIEFPDGTRLDVLGTGNYGLNLLLKPSAALRQTAVGLWGPVAGGEFLRIPALPDGTNLPDATDGHDYYQKVYVQFADAWRVTQAESLFDYNAGTSTDTYTVKPFPAETSVLTIDDLTPEQRQRGEEACKAISIKFIHDQCVFDVGLTGETGFVAMYDLTAGVVATGNLTASGQRYRVVNLYSDASTAGADQLDVYGWDGYASFTDANAGLLKTVGYEQVTDFFDPGVASDSFGDPITQLSIQRHGQPPNAFRLNLYDRPIDAIPGTVMTLLLTPDSADSQSFSVGGVEIYDDLVFEQRPGEEDFLPKPLQDQGLLVGNVTGLVHGLDQPHYFYVSLGDGCLTDPEFTTINSWLGGGGGESRGAQMAAPPGSYTLTLHDGPDNGSFTREFSCDNEPIAPGVPITIEAGKISTLFLYATPGNPQVKVLPVPYGQ